MSLTKRKCFSIRVIIIMIIIVMPKEFASLRTRFVILMLREIKSVKERVVEKCYSYQIIIISK
jgi:hypothetical protein